MPQQLNRTLFRKKVARNPRAMLTKEEFQRMVKMGYSLWRRTNPI